MEVERVGVGVGKVRVREAGTRNTFSWLSQGFSIAAERTLHSMAAACGTFPSRVSPARDIPGSSLVRTRTKEAGAPDDGPGGTEWTPPPPLTKERHRTKDQPAGRHPQSPRTRR